MSKTNDTDLDIRIVTGPEGMEGEKFTIDLVEAVPDGTPTESQREGFTTAWEVVEAVAESEDGEDVAAVMAIGLAISYGVVRLVNRIRSANNTTILFASLNPDIQIVFDEVDIDKGNLLDGLSHRKIESTRLAVKGSYTEGLVFASEGRSEGHISGKLIVAGKAEPFKLHYENPLGKRQNKSRHFLYRPNPIKPYTTRYTTRGSVSMVENDNDKNRQDIVSVIFM